MEKPCMQYNNPKTSNILAPMIDMGPSGMINKIADAIKIQINLSGNCQS